MKSRNVIAVPKLYHAIFSGLYAVPLYHWIGSGSDWTLTRYVEIVSDTGTVDKITVGVKSYTTKTGCKIAAGKHNNSCYVIK